MQSMSETNSPKKSRLARVKKIKKTITFAVTCLENRQAEENPDSAVADVQEKPIALGKPDYAIVCK
jgi:hypothetical protein